MTASPRTSSWAPSLSAWRSAWGLSADGAGNGDGPEHELMRNLIGCFAAYERALVAARTKAALRVKKAKGQRVGAIPLGYRLADDGGRLEEDPREQEAIALVHELREEDLSLRAIDRELRRCGYRPPGGKRWHVQTISNILQAEATATT